MKISTVAQMQAMDRQAIVNFSIPEELLMENAGLAVVQVILRELGITGQRSAVVCGGGNNGGDGFVIARKLLSLGGAPEVFLLVDPSRYSGVARLNYELLTKLPIPITHIHDQAEIPDNFEQFDLIIDAIFGTGLTRSVTGKYEQIIRAVNQCVTPVMSVDIPSGINGDTGQIMGVAVNADWTVTFGAPKIGSLLYPGFANCGRLSLSRISFPPELYNNDDLTITINSTPPLPPRPPAGHKGSFGEVLFIAGAANYYGAPYFAAYSFLKAGGGYSRLAAPKSIIGQIGRRGRELVFHPMDETEKGSLARSNLDELVNLASSVDMVVVGPGLSLAEETAELVRALIPRLETPLLIDGDGLTAIAGASLTTERAAPTILTPHPGELARLLDRPIKEILADPVASLSEATHKYDSIVVFKGAHSLIGAPAGEIAVNLSGNDGMGSAGSGDVLTGAIAAMYTAGLPPDQAVGKGVFIHGLAGDLARRKLGADGMTAADILANLPAAVNYDRQGLDDKLRDKYELELLA